MQPRADQAHRSRELKTVTERPQGAPPAGGPPTPREGKSSLLLPAEALLRDLQALNERLIELLVRTARSEEPATLPLVAQLRSLLREMSPESQRRAARRPFSLVNMDFESEREWCRGLGRRNRRHPLPTVRGAFPPVPALQLARSTLTLAWHSVRADRAAASFFFGMPTAVAHRITGLTLTEIEWIAAHHFRRARPRWQDRYGFWRQMLQAAQSEDLRHAREVDLRGLRLMGAALISAEDP